MYYETITDDPLFVYPYDFRLRSGPCLGFVVSPELQELLPGIINELGSENLANLKEIAGNLSGAEGGVVDDDDDVPDLVENFEDASK